MCAKKIPRTVTGTHFVEKKPDQTRAESVPLDSIPKGRVPIKRMSWGANPGEKSFASASEIAETIRFGAASETVFFLDSCFLRAPLSDDIWKALCTKTLVIPPCVKEELDVWMKSPNHNSLRSDEVRRRLRICTELPVQDSLGDEVRGKVAGYYHFLLALRKLVGKKFALEYEFKHGCTPSKEEFFSAFKQADEKFDDRAARLAWKGNEDFSKDNYTSDEQIVIMAVLNALSTGRETVILTRDHDLMEQFYKLLYLMDTHYRSMLAAERYTASPQDFIAESTSNVMPGGQDYFGQWFQGADDMLFKESLPGESGWDSLLPKESDLVNAGCMWFADGPEDLQVASMTFCADTEMRRLLQVKAESNGMNTNLFGDRNCHLSPCEILGESIGAYAAIATDKMQQLGPGYPPIRALDYEHAIRSGERFNKIELK